MTSILIADEFPAAWSAPRGKVAKYYHTTQECLLQLPTPIVAGYPEDAERKGITLCPDCEKANGPSN